MAQNDFLPFANDAGSAPNLEALADYLANNKRKFGEVTGLADPKRFNRSIRQSSKVMAALMQSVSDITEKDVLDLDGDEGMALLIQLIKESFITSSKLASALLPKVAFTDFSTTGNANGTAIKFPDGSMVQHGSVTTDSSGWGYATFPIPFMAPPPVLLQQIGDIQNSAAHGLNASTTTGVQVFGRSVSGTGTSRAILWYAIGRWK